MNEKRTGEQCADKFKYLSKCSRISLLETRLRILEGHVGKKILSSWIGFFQFQNKHFSEEPDSRPDYLPIFFW